MLPRHIWEGRSEEEVMDGANEDPVGTGAYEYHAHEHDRMVWVRRDGWWATDAFGCQRGVARPEHDQGAGGRRRVPARSRPHHRPGPDPGVPGLQRPGRRPGFGEYLGAWSLAEELDNRPVEDVEGMQEVISHIEETQLSEMPITPLWYNGLWSQVNSQVWTNWPSAERDTPNHAPTTWRNWLEMGRPLMLTELEPAAG